MSFLNNKRTNFSREWVLKSLMVVDLTSSLDSSVNFCFMYFEALLLGMVID